MGCLKTHIEWEPNLRLVYSNWASNMFQGVGGASSGGGSSSGNNGGITNGFAAIVGLHSDANGNIISNGSYEGIGNGFLSDGTNFVDLFDGEVYDLNPVDIGVVKNRFTGFSDGQTGAIYGNVIAQLNNSKFGDDSFGNAMSSISFGLVMGETTRQALTYGRFGATVQNVEKAFKSKQYFYKGQKYWMGNYAKAPYAANQVRSAVKYAKTFGKTLTVANIGLAGVQLYNSDRSGADIARFGGSLLITGSAFIPVVGPFISIGLGVADSMGAFDGIYNSFD